MKTRVIEEFFPKVIHRWNFVCVAITSAWSALGCDGLPGVNPERAEAAAVFGGQAELNQRLCVTFSSAASIRRKPGEDR
jgi:hypothetical protein